MATGMDASCFEKRRRITIAGSCASSLPAAVRIGWTTASRLAEITGKRVAKSGGGTALAARARSESEVTLQAFIREAASDPSCAVAVDSAPSSEERRTAAMAARAIQ